MMNLHYADLPEDVKKEVLRHIVTDFVLAKKIVEQYADRTSGKTADKSAISEDDKH